jgi:hypothetical protein
MKKLFRYLPAGSPAYLVLHAKWRFSRGHRLPAAISPATRNPRLALQVAEREFARDTIMVCFAKAVPAQMNSAITKKLLPARALIIYTKSFRENAQEWLAILREGDFQYDFERELAFGSFREAVKNSGFTLSSLGTSEEELESL